jgi:hypothetical protein
MIHRLYARHPTRLWTSTVTPPNQVWVGDYYNATRLHSALDYFSFIAFECQAA